MKGLRDWLTNDPDASWHGVIALALLLAVGSFILGLPS